MASSVRHLAVFCGSALGSLPIYAEQARELGRRMAERSIGLVYGGGRIGLMGEIALAVKRAGGEVIGVIPKALSEKEIALTDVNELILVDTMHQRKAIMADRAEGFIAMPGGFGTCDELFEILTWAQLSIHQKPIGLLNVHHFFDPMLAWLDQMVEAGLLKPKHRNLLLVETEPHRLLDRLTQTAAPEMEEKWFDREIR